MEGKAAFDKAGKDYIVFMSIQIVTFLQRTPVLLNLAPELQSPVNCCRQKEVVSLAVLGKAKKLSEYPPHLASVSPLRKEQLLKVNHFVEKSLKKSPSFPFPSPYS